MDVLRIKVFVFSGGFSESVFLILVRVDLKSGFLILVGGSQNQGV